LGKLLQDQGPRKNGQEQKEPENYARNPARLLKKGERIGKEQKRRAGNRFPPEINFFCQANLP
jgi:hypothetical protein